VKRCGVRAKHRTTRPCGYKAGHGGKHSWDLRQPTWDRKSVVEALREWARLYGVSPRYEEWQSRDTSDRWAWPSPPTVIKYLKARNWGDALSKVGLETHPPGGYSYPCENCDRYARAPGLCHVCRNYLAETGERWTPTEERRARRAAEARERIVADIRDWADRFGAPPRASDWNLGQARAQGHFDRVERYRETGRKWPSPTHVINHFGQWGAAIEAAGFRRPEVGKYERTPEVRAKMSAGQQRRRRKQRELVR
jgi:hypothetical protein